MRKTYTNISLINNYDFPFPFLFFFLIRSDEKMFDQYESRFFTYCIEYCT